MVSLPPEVAEKIVKPTCVLHSLTELPAFISAILNDEDMESALSPCLNLSSVWNMQLQKSKYIHDCQRFVHTGVSSMWPLGFSLKGFRWGVRSTVWRWRGCRLWCCWIVLHYTDFLLACPPMCVCTMWLQCSMHHAEMFSGGYNSQMFYFLNSEVIPVSYPGTVETGEDVN